LRAFVVAAGHVGHLLTLAILLMDGIAFSRYSA
jgi:hypothetical protein